MKLTPAQLDRACGAVLGLAAGDALGAPYEFGMAAVGPDGPRPIGGGLGDFAPGEWTDDTTMAWAVLDVAATGADLRTEDGLTSIARRFRGWYESGPADIGNQTRGVLAAAGVRPTGARMAEASQELHRRTGRSAGNGSLMRTAPVALAHLDDAAACAEAARLVGALTHWDARAQEACVLWTLAIRHAILCGEFDVRSGLAHLDADAASYWTDRLDDAEGSEPARFQRNGWVVGALQAAWSAIVHTPVPADDSACLHLQDALATAIGIGHDTDTVAAIAGALLGAQYGASAVPARWRRILHGYPGLTGEQLVELAHRAATSSRPNGWPDAARIDYSTWAAEPVIAQHPHDTGVWLGNALILDELPSNIGAVVSLCLLGHDQVPAGVQHVGFRLIDRPEPAQNPNLNFLLADAARTVADLRAEGHEVLIHCVAAQSRTPAVGIAYSLLLGIAVEDATREVCAVLPAAAPNPGFAAALADSRG